MTMATTSAMGDQAPPPRPPAAPPGTASLPSWGAVVMICLTLAIVHSALVWGHVIQFWGDTGRWMHEVDRFANGERLYTDFTWPFPPLGMWMLGTAARFVGTGVHQLWVLTCTIYVITVLLFLRYLRLVVPRDLALVTGVAALVGALAYAQVGGAPLPLGMYGPPVVIGGMFLLASVGCLVALIGGDHRWGTAAGLGLAASLAVLTKQDFWVPAFAVVVLGIRHAPPRSRLLIAATAVAPALAGFLVVAAQVGIDGFLAMLDGFGHVTHRGGRGLPSGRRLTAELGASGGMLVLGILVVRPRATRAWLGVTGLLVAVVLVYLVQEGRPGLRLLVDDVRLRGLSLFLPAIVGGWLWTASRTVDSGQGRLAAALLIVALAARARRGFEGLEWFHILLELPAYALTLRAVLGTHRMQWQRLAMTAMIPLACQSYWVYGQGPLTARGGLRIETVETTRGRVYLRPNAAEDYRAAAAMVQVLDPTGRRPLFAFGYSGGWNYFLSRPNPTGAPQGFLFTRAPAESTLARAQAARPIVFDARLYTQVPMRDFRAGLFRWEAPEVPSTYMRFDRPFFDRLIAGCRWVGQHPAHDNPFLVVYDCGG